MAPDVAEMPSEYVGKSPQGEASHEVFFSEVSTSRVAGLFRDVRRCSYRAANLPNKPSVVDREYNDIPVNLTIWFDISIYESVDKPFHHESTGVYASGFDVTQLGRHECVSKDSKHEQPD